MTLFLAMVGIANASANVDFLGHIAINVNGTWYYTDNENHDWCTGGDFNGANLGTFANTLRLSGQSQTWESGNVNWNGGTVTMYYKIDNGAAQSIGLNYFKFNNNNNYFQYGGSNFAFHPIDISGLSVNEQHTISIWFNCGDKWDSNNNANYVATFNVTDKVSYIDENGDLQSHEAKSISDNTITTLNEEWYVVDRDITINHTLQLKGNVNIILADGCTMNMGTDSDPISGDDDDAIWADNETPGNLTIYGQEEGTGELTIYADGDGIHTNYDGYITINGGTINTIVKYNGIFTGNLTMNGGTLNASSEESCGINVDQNITNNGGSINATGGSSGIMANGGNITINGGEVNATGNEYGAEYVIFAGENISIYNGTVTINGDNAEDGIHANGDIIIEDGTVTVSKDKEDTDYAEDAIYAYGAINITGGTVVANGSSCGIYTEDDITISKGTVTASGYYNSGISASGDITINGGKVDATSSSEPGIYAGDDITINDGTVSTTDCNYGLYAANDITITGGTVTTTDSGNGIYSSNNITISGGTIYSTNTQNGIYCYSGDITISGGDIDSDGSECGILVYNKDHNFIISSGTVNASGEYGIKSWNIDIYGGTINATGTENGIIANSISLQGGSVKANSYNYKSTVTIAEGLNYSDGTECSNTFGDLDNTKTLQPCVKAKKYDNNYWTTFYSGSVGFTIDDAVNAYAYTAELGTDEITMHLLGKVIPKETAVIIVSESETITMSADAATNVSTVPLNNLHGVDVATATSSVLSDYPGATTLYFLSNQNSNFGFHDFSGATVPARKAFLALDDSNGARGFSMVFEDDATGIRSIDSGKDAIGNEAGAWYDLRGRRLSGKPSQRGIYVNNGKKIVIK